MILKNIIKTIILASVVSTSFAVDVAPTSVELKKLISQSSSLSSNGFNDWLSQISQQYPGANASYAAAIDGTPLTEDQVELLGRLLGVWNLNQNELKALEHLSQSIAIPTFLSDEYPNYDNPQFIKFGTFIQGLAENFGLAYRNVDGRIFEVTLDGNSEEAFGILTHADIVPVNKDNWGLEDGTKIDPFVMQIIGNKIYGRGSLDDKGSIITALYSMKAIKDSGLPLKRDIRLMIETTEETSGAGMEYYMEHNAVPDYNIVLDSDYPAVTAEKGYGTINAFFPVAEMEGDVVISAMDAATATNQIPEKASAILRATNPEALAAKINAMSSGYSQGPNGDFKITTVVDGNQVILTVAGVSAHASEPETGNNPLPRLMQILVESEINPVRNHWFAASEYINTLYGVDYTGQKMDAAFADDFMGALTLSPTFVELSEGKARVAVNVRAPRGKSKEELKDDLELKLNGWNQSTEEAVSFDVSTTDWMYRDPNGKWLATLLDIYGDTTGNKAEPVSSPGSTTAKLLPNAINFGPNMPGDKYMGHNSNEFKRLDVFRLDMQMFTEMMLRISHLENLE